MPTNTINTTVNGGTLLAGTTDVVVLGGLLENVTVSSGGAVTVSSGGHTSALAISSGAVMNVSSGGIDSGSTVYAGGSAVVIKGATEQGLVVNGGSLNISGAASASNVTVLNHGTIELATTSSTVTSGVTFAGAGTLLELGNAVLGTTGALATISGFGTGDVIDISSVTTVGAHGTVGVTSSVSVNNATSLTTFDVISGGSTLAYIFAGTSIAQHLVVAGDGAGGVAINYNTAYTVSVGAATTSTGLSISSGGTLDVLNGGTVVSTIVQNGGTVVIASGAIGSATTVQTGGIESVLGTESGDTVGGTQIVSGANAVISNETIAGGTLGITVSPEQGIVGAGTVDLDVAASAASNIVVSGGVLALSGSTSATNVTIENVGTVALDSANATLSGTVAFSGGGRIVVAAAPVAGAGVQAVISGFGTGDAIDLTSATAIGAAFNAGSATLSSTTSGGNTVVTVSGGGSSESFTLAGTVAVSAITDAAGGLDITTLPTITSFTAGDLVVSIEGDATGGYTVADDQASPVYLEELTTTGSIVGIMVLPQNTQVVNGVTQYAISGEFGSQSELSLQLSGDGQSLTVMGYGANAQAYEADQAAYGSTTFAQTYDTTNSGYIAVPRIVADISYSGAVDTSTALYNVYSQNNPRSAYTINGSQFYVSGQGTGNQDGSQGLYFTQDGANTASVISQAAETRMVTIYNGQLYVSRDDKSVGGGAILDYGTDPTGATTGTALSGIGPSVTLTSANGNTLYGAGVTAYLSPENFFFASPTVLYIADGGAPKDSAGSEKIGTLATDGGLQKWVLDTTTNTWSLAYTLSAGLNLVSQDNTVDGTSGLLGLTGSVNAATGAVTFYATNYVLSDFDPTYLYTITDNINNTASQAAGESFTQLLAGVSASYNLRGIAFAPTSAAATGSATVVGAAVTSSGVTVTSGGSITVQSGGTATGTTIEAGGAETVSAGGVVSASDIVNGATDLLFGSATADYLGGSQTVSGGQITNEVILNGGIAVLSGSVATGTTVETGGRLSLRAGSTASNTVLQGGLIALSTSSDTLSGAETFTTFGGTIRLAAIASAGAGIQGVVSGWGAGDVIDFQAISSGATLALSTSAGNTVATVTSGGVTQQVTFAGLAPSQSVQLVSDGFTGEELTFLSPPLVVVSSGVISTGLNIYAGTVTVSSGGTLSGAGVYAGGSATIQTGGVDQGSTIYAGGFETELGSATGDLVYGTQLVSAAAAIVSNETVYAGGAVDLFLAGANGTGIVDSGGQINISGRGTLTNATLLSGASLSLQSPKATISGTLTFSGAATLIETATLSSVSAGIYFGDEAEIIGFGGGDAIDLTSATQAAAGNAALTLTTGTLSGAAYAGSPISGATVTSATITFTPATTGAPSSEVFTFAGTSLASQLVLSPDGSGGVELVVGSGVASGSSSTGASVGSGTVLVVSSGGTASGAIVSSGGTETVVSGGIDQGATIQMGGTQVVLGSASGDLVYGSQVVSSGGIASNETVFAGGSISLTGATATGLVVSSGGSVNLGSGSTLSNTTLNTGTITLNGPTALLTGSLSLDPGNTIVVTSDQPNGYQDQAVISGFGPGDTIDLTSTTNVGSAYAASPSPSALTITTSGGNTVASITEGATTDSFIFAGTTIGTGLVLGSDGNGGAALTYLACFASGTRIQLDGREVAVEALQVGDLVETVSGVLRPVRWIGRRRINCDRHPFPHRAWPVRIAAGAFGAGLPRRDLLVSPNHALYLDGVLVPAKVLINGRNITQAQAGQIEYFHIELDRHDVLFAEGLAAESYLDVGDRAVFENGGAVMTLFPDMADSDWASLMWESQGYAAIKLVGREVEAIKARLLLTADQDDNQARQARG